MNTNIISPIVKLVFVAIILMYLHKMEICECVDNALVKRMEYTEVAIAALAILNLATGGKRPSEISNKKYIGFIINLGIFGLFGYLAYLHL